MQVILPGGSTSHGAEPGALDRGLLMWLVGAVHCELTPGGPAPEFVVAAFELTFHGRGRATQCEEQSVATTQVSSQSRGEEPRAPLLRS